MKNFTFHNPTKIIFGEGMVTQIGAEAKAFGKKALLIYGRKNIKESGLYDRVLSSLGGAGLAVIEHPGVRSNPVLSHVNEGIAIAKKEKVDLIVAVGGGSVIDESKGIAAGALVDSDVWDFYVGKATIQAALPVLTILTIPATGSEMNGGTVITHDETRHKVGFGDPHLYPKVSILDPTVTCTLPPDYNAYSAVDAISHLIEGYFTAKDARTPLQDRLVEGLVRTIMESTELILKNPLDYEGRATFMWAATLAWNGLCTAGIGSFAVPMHLLEHPLSALYDIPHGAGLSITIPAWMTWAAAKQSGRFARFAERVFNIKTRSPERTAQQGVEALKQWFKKIGSPTTLSAANIPAGDIEKIAGNTEELARIWKMGEYTRELIIKLYRLCA